VSLNQTSVVRGEGSEPVTLIHDRMPQSNFKSKCPTKEIFGQS